jgi:hypothetical protein
MAIARLGSISLDCADPLALATFWAGLLGGEIAFESDDFVAVKTDGVWISAVRVPDYTPPTWPEGATAKQMHLDLAVDDLTVAAHAAVELGAHVATEQPGADRWQVLVDPAGHPFCLTLLIPE